MAKVLRENFFPGGYRGCKMADSNGKFCNRRGGSRSGGKSHFSKGGPKNPYTPLAITAELLVNNLDIIYS